MATIDGLTKARMLLIEAASVVSGVIVGNDLILTKHDGTTLDAGNVRGPIGNTGATGVAGPTGPAGNITVAASTIANDSLTGLAARDGYTPSAADLILVLNQATPAQNGIYSAAAGAWSRWASATSALQVASLGVVQVRYGLVNGGSQFTTSFNQSKVVGTDDQIWSELTADHRWDYLSRTADLTGTLTHYPESSAGGAFGFSNVFYYKDEIGVVWGAGLIYNTSSIALGTVLFTLPKGYRPGKTLRFSCIGVDGPRAVIVRPNGDVILAGAIGSITTGTALPAGGYLSLDSVHFPAEDVPNPPVWTDLTSLFINGWTNVGTVGSDTYPNLRMWMDPVGDTHVQGALKNASPTPTMIFTSSTPAAFHTQGAVNSVYAGATAYFGGSSRVDYNGSTTTGELLGTFNSGSDNTGVFLDNIIIPTSKNPSKWRKHGALTNSWAVFGANPPSYYKNPMGRVFNRGLITGGTSNTTWGPAFDRADWFQPRAIRIQVGIANAGSCRLDANPGGVAAGSSLIQGYFSGGTNAFVSLTDVQWDTIPR